MAKIPIQGAGNIGGSSLLRGPIKQATPSDSAEKMLIQARTQIQEQRQKAVDAIETAADFDDETNKSRIYNTVTKKSQALVNKYKANPSDNAYIELKSELEQLSNMIPEDAFNDKLLGQKVRTETELLISKAIGELSISHANTKMTGLKIANKEEEFNRKDNMLSGVNKESIDAEAEGLHEFYISGAANGSLSSSEAVAGTSALRSRYKNAVKYRLDNNDYAGAIAVYESAKDSMSEVDRTESKTMLDKQLKLNKAQAEKEKKEAYIKNQKDMVDSISNLSKRDIYQKHSAGEIDDKTLKEAIKFKDLNPNQKIKDAAVYSDLLDKAYSVAESEGVDITTTGGIKTLEGERSKVDYTDFWLSRGNEKKRLDNISNYHSELMQALGAGNITQAQYTKLSSWFNEGYDEAKTEIYGNKATSYKAVHEYVSKGYVGEAKNSRARLWEDFENTVDKLKPKTSEDYLNIANSVILTDLKRKYPELGNATEAPQHIYDGKSKASTGSAAVATNAENKEDKNTIMIKYKKTGETKRVTLESYENIKSNDAYEVVK